MKCNDYKIYGVIQQHKYELHFNKIELGIERVQACIVLANILHSLYVARTPSVEAHSPGRCSNVENAPRRRPVTSQPATPTSHTVRNFENAPRHPPAARADPAQTAIRTMSSYRRTDASL